MEGASYVIILIQAMQRSFEQHDCEWISHATSFVVPCLLPVEGDPGEGARLKGMSSILGLSFLTGKFDGKAPQLQEPESPESFFEVIL